MLQSRQVARDLSRLKALLYMKGSERPRSLPFMFFNARLLFFHEMLTYFSRIIDKPS